MKVFSISIKASPPQPIPSPTSLPCHHPPPTHPTRRIGIGVGICIGVGIGIGIGVGNGIGIGIGVGVGVGVCIGIGSVIGGVSGIIWWQHLAAPGSIWDPLVASGSICVHLAPLQSDASLGARE